MSHSQHHTEPEILLWKMVVNDDEKAFEKIFALFYPPLFLFAKKYIVEHAACEDIVQDTFVSLWEGRKKLTITSSLHNYLTVSVRNNCLNYLKKEGVIRQYQESISMTSDENNEDVYTLTELYEMLNKTLSKLPENYRIVFEMHRMEGKNYDEIAEKLKLSVRTVKRYKSQAIELLKDDLKDYLHLIIICTLLN